MPFNDPTPAHLRKLHPTVAAAGFRLINAAREAGVPLYISSSLRTVQEQATLVRRGASRTMKSKHVAGRAFDVDVLGYNRNQIPKEWLQALGEYGEQLGLTWGGRWTSFYDGGHFEM